MTQILINDSKAYAVIQLETTALCMCVCVYGVCVGVGKGVWQAPKVARIQKQLFREWHFGGSSSRYLLRIHSKTPQWVLETVYSTEPYLHTFPPVYTYIPMIKFTL